MAHLIAPARDVLYLGRGADYPLALEGALKLKEISYIHAEGYAAGEMKHGPIALIDEAVPVIVLAPSGPLFEKTVEQHAGSARARRQGRADFGCGRHCRRRARARLATIEMPTVHPLIAPLVYAVPVQLLAYHVAVVEGDGRGPAAQPRQIGDGGVRRQPAMKRGLSPSPPCPPKAAASTAIRAMIATSRRTARLSCAISSRTSVKSPSAPNSALKHFGALAQFVFGFKPGVEPVEIGVVPQQIGSLAGLRGAHHAVARRRARRPTMRITAGMESRALPLT